MSDEPYKKLILWKELVLLRKTIFEKTAEIQKGNYRLVEQMRAAARSAKQNFAEGYKLGSINQFINFCLISRASLEELNEDINDCNEDGLINEIEYIKISSLTKRTMFLMDRYISSLKKMKNDNTWRTGK